MRAQRDTEIGRWLMPWITSGSALQGGLRRATTISSFRNALRDPGLVDTVAAEAEESIASGWAFRFHFL
jgi:hypothetical protein